MAECFLRCTQVGFPLQEAAVKLAVGKTLWISCPFMIYQMMATAVNCALPACTAFFFDAAVDCACSSLSSVLIESQPLLLDAARRDK